MNDKPIPRLSTIEKIDIVGTLTYTPGGMFHPVIQIMAGDDGIYNLMALFKQHALDNRVIVLSAEIMEVVKENE